MISNRRWSPFGSRFAVLLLVSGCASVNPRDDYDRVDRQVEAVVGQAVGYRPGDEPALRSKVATLLEGGLTSDEAVQLALLNNPRGWAALLRAGMARADVVQAGLFSNPSLGLSFLLPEGGGTTQFELGLAQNIADAWLIPARTRAARRDLDRAILEAAREVAGLALDAKVAYFSSVGAERTLEITRENLRLVERLHQVTQARLDAGAVGALDVNLARGLVLRAEVDERNARLRAAAARRTLATLLGLADPADDLRLAEPLPPPLAAPLETARLVDVAHECRLDLRAARDAVRAAEARVEFELARVFQNVELAFELQRQALRAQPGRKLLADTARASIASGRLAAPDIESRGQRRLARSEQIEAILGPSLNLTLPIFDQNQAQIAKARLALAEADALSASLERAVTQETREAADRLATAWSVAQLYHEEVLPQAEKTLELSRSAYEAGSTPILNVIDAQRSLLEMRQAYVAALENAAIAGVDLERATARPIPYLLQAGGAATQPASTQPGPDAGQPQERIR